MRHLCQGGESQTTSDGEHAVASASGGGSTSESRGSGLAGGAGGTGGVGTAGTGHVVGGRDRGAATAATSRAGDGGGATGNGARAGSSGARGRAGAVGVSITLGLEAVLTDQSGSLGISLGASGADGQGVVQSVGEVGGGALGVQALVDSLFEELLVIE